MYHSNPPSPLLRARNTAILKAYLQGATWVQASRQNGVTEHAGRTGVINLLGELLERYVDKPDRARMMRINAKSLRANAKDWLAILDQADYGVLSIKPALQYRP